MSDAVTFLTLPDRELAYQRIDTQNTKKKPLLFLGGYATDMNGTKARFLAENCAAESRGLVRFDYRGHGLSSDTFLNGTIGGWLDDALKIFDAFCPEPTLLVGSSMGGWIALLLARARPERVAGFIGIAAAPDFTEDLILPALSPAQCEELAREGLTYEEGAPQDFRIPVTAKLLEEAKEHLLLRAPLNLACPVHLLQGQLDKDVPWRHALKITETLTAPNVRLTLIQDGDHRLSREEDLKLLWHTVEEMD